MNVYTIDREFYREAINLFQGFIFHREEKETCFLKCSSRDKRYIENTLGTTLNLVK